MLRLMKLTSVEIRVGEQAFLSLATRSCRGEFPQADFWLVTLASGALDSSGGSRI